MDVLAYGRLAQVKRFRCFAEGGLFGYGAKDFQPKILHPGFSKDKRKAPESAPGLWNESPAKTTRQ
jgi:hypothetical protein